MSEALGDRCISECFERLPSIEIESSDERLNNLRRSTSFTRVNPTRARNIIKSCNQMPSEGLLINSYNRDDRDRQCDSFSNFIDETNSKNTCLSSTGEVGAISRFSCTKRSGSLNKLKNFSKGVEKLASHTFLVRIGLERDTQYTFTEYQKHIRESQAIGHIECPKPKSILINRESTNGSVTTLGSYARSEKSTECRKVTFNRNLTIFVFESERSNNSSE